MPACISCTRPEHLARHRGRQRACVQPLSPAGELSLGWWACSLGERAVEQWTTCNGILMYCHDEQLMWLRCACQMPPCSSQSCSTGKLGTSVCCALQMQRADAQDAQLQQEWGEILAAQGRSMEAATHLSAAAALFTQQMAEAPAVLVVRF